MRALEQIAATPLVGLVAAVRAALDGSGPAILPLAAGAAAEPAGSPAIEPPAIVPTAIALVIATSGSSGAPKLVALRSSALLASAAATESVLGGPGSWVLALPGHYIAGVQVIVRALAAGVDPIAMSEGPFTAAGFAEAVSRLPPTGRRYTALVPTQLHRLVAAIEAGDAGIGDAGIGDAVRSLDTILIGGGRLEPGLADRASRLGIRFRRTYGASETAGGCVYDGVPLAGVEVRVVGDEVQLASPTLADGYLRDDSRTESTFLREPGRTWYRTGDAGSWDGSTLRVVGRLDDVIISGGEKVSLARIESVVRELPGLEEAVVVRATSAEWGEVPIVAATAVGDLVALRAHVVEQLGKAAAPARILTFSALPMLASGKPDRRRLTELAHDAGGV